MKKTFTCIMCPLGCTVTYDDGKITGNKCPRGLEYVKNEIEHPMRMLTTTMKTINGQPVPVRTSDMIPKDKIFEAMKIINSTKIDRDVKMGDVIIKNIVDGVDIISSKTNKLN
jgi:CxxC motif-containing protein